MTDQTPLSLAAAGMDRLIQKWVHDQELFINSNGNQGRPMTEPEMRTVLRRLKDCNIETPQFKPDQDWNHEEVSGPIKFDTALPQLSTEPDPAANDKG